MRHGVSQNNFKWVEGITKNMNGGEASNAGNGVEAVAKGPRIKKSDSDMKKMPFRSAYVGDPFTVFKSNSANANLTEEAHSHIMLDYAFIEKQQLEKDLARQTQNFEREKLKNLVQSRDFAALKAAVAKNIRVRPKGKKAHHASDIFVEDEELKRGPGQPKQPARILAEYYGVSKKTILKVVNQANVDGQMLPKKKKGRPSQLTPTKRKAIVEEHNKVKGRTTLRRMAVNLKQRTTWLTQKQGAQSVSPSASTICRELNDGTFTKRIIRKRPFLDEVAITERKKFAPEALQRDDELTECHDEAYIQIRLHNGCLIFDELDQIEEEEPQAAPAQGRRKKPKRDIPVEFDSGGKHEPKIFLFGSVTKPRTIMQEGKMYLDPNFDGRILLARVRGVKRRKRNRLRNGEIVNRAGDPMYEPVTIDGYRYKQICETQNGLFDSMINYYETPDKSLSGTTSREINIDLDKESEYNAQVDRLACAIPATNYQPHLYIAQEDGAPGHGYNNRKGGIGNLVHKSIVHAAALRRIRLLKQSRHSPEVNYCDLGLWNLLKKAVENRSHEIPEYSGKNAAIIEDAIWNCVKDTWDNLDCTLLYYIAMQRRAILELIIEQEGKSIVKEPHTGIRKRHKFSPQSELQT